MKSAKFYSMILAFAVCGISQACAQDIPEIVGCYLAEPPLTYSAAGNLERGDSSWSRVRLLADGTARRPLLKERYDRSSTWRIEGDTLHVIFVDGLVGWRLELTPAPIGWTGRATYITDAPVVGELPPQHQITLTRRACGPT
jgi:hypothetical protein